VIITTKDRVCKSLLLRLFFKNAIFPRKLWSKHLNPIGYGYGFCKNLAFIKVWAWFHDVWTCGAKVLEY
jgi:hypothetical protein